MFTGSIRWRLNLWLGFLLVCALTGFGVVLYHLQRNTQFADMDQKLERRVAALSAEVRTGPGDRRGPGGFPGGSSLGDNPPLSPGAADRPGFDSSTNSRSRGGLGGFDGPGNARSGRREFRLSRAVTSLFDGGNTNGFYYTIWTADGSLGRQSSNAPPGLAWPEREAHDTRTHLRTRGDFREGFHFTERGDCVLAGRTRRMDLAALDRFTFWLLGAGGVVLAFSLGVGWWLTTRAIKPVENISAAASRISAGNLSERIAVPGAGNELGQLAAVLNSTFGRLEAAFAQQKQFTADASHELRTPLAVIISETQTTLARERSAAEYRETIENCHEAAQQMRRLAQSLLELARFDAGQEPMEHTQFDLAEEVLASVELIAPLARERGLKLHHDLAPALIRGDASHVHQVITNLLTNAIYYNRDGGEIQVKTHAANGSAILTVADTGVGLSPEDLPHIFKRFYRADKSRARANGQSGLGLAISKAIMDAHGGSIEVASQPGEGTTFTVKWPA